MKNLIYIPITAVLFACGTKKSPKNEAITFQETTSQEVSQIDESTPLTRAVYHPSETVQTDLIHTKLEVNFNWNKSEMNGIAEITAKPHFYSTDSLILDAKGMLVHSVSMNGASLNFEYKDDFIRINLGKKFTKEEKYTVKIDYTARPESRTTGGSAAISSDKGLYFINPKGENKNQMPQIWTQGETEASSVWFPTIDAPNAKTSQETIITVQDKFVTLSNGKLISSTKNEDGTRTDHWKQELAHAPYLFMMGVGEFKIIQDSYTRKDGSKMEVNYYVEPEWEQYADDIFGDTPEMIEYFSNLLGVEYPWDKYNQIIVREYVSGAMENTSAVIFGDYAYKTDRELLDSDDNSTIAHELFHHWFGDLVTAESWSNLTINESFANYSQFLWDEYKYGAYEADYQAENEMEGYFQSAAQQGYHNLVWFDYDNKEDMFDGHSYNKGGRILNMLRNYIGDEAFFTGLQNFLSENKFTAVEFHQLRLAFEKVTGEDLNWFFNQWYLNAAHPNLVFTHKVDSANNMVNVTVEQTQDLSKYPIFKLPVQMHVYDDNGKNVYPVTIDQANQTFNFALNGNLKGIVFDGQEMLLAKVKENKTKAEYIHQYYNSDKYRTKKRAIVKGTSKSPEGQQLILDAMNDDFWELRKTAIAKVKILKGEYLAKSILKLKDLAQNDPKSAVRSAAVLMLAKKYKEDDLTQILIDRIEKDSSYLVVGSSLEKLAKIDSDEALKIAESLENDPSAKMALGIAKVYSQLGNSSKFQYFENKLINGNLSGFDQLSMLNSFTVFISSKDVDMYAKSIEVYKALNVNPDLYMSMFLPQNITYLSGKCKSTIDTLKTRLAKEEENDQPAYAQKTRDEIVKYQNVLKELEGIK